MRDKEKILKTSREKQRISMVVDFLKVTLAAKRQWRNDFRIPKKTIIFYLDFNTWSNFHFTMILHQRYCQVCEVW